MMCCVVQHMGNICHVRYILVLFYISEFKFFFCCTNKGTVNCYLYVNCVIFVQREEKEDYAAEAQFVSEHGNVLARKVSQPCFHH